jgi:hypothetical protein
VNVCTASAQSLCRLQFSKCESVEFHIISERKFIPNQRLVFGVPDQRLGFPTSVWSAECELRKMQCCHTIVPNIDCKDQTGFTISSRQGESELKDPWRSRSIHSASSTRSNRPHYLRIKSCDRICNVLPCLQLGKHGAINKSEFLTYNSDAV